MNYNNLEELKANISRDTLIENPTLGSVNGILLSDSHMATDANNAAPSHAQMLADNGKNEAKSAAPAKPSKYHNQRTPYNGKVYDSKKEALHATELDLAVRAHIIDFWLYHVRFPLPCDTVYEADFVPFKCRGSASRNGLWEIEVHEVKGYWTPEAKRKMKLFKKHYPNIKVVII